MRRVLCYLKWREEWWIDRGKQRKGTRSDIQEGLQAYACKQGSIMGQLAQKFGDEWYPLLLKRGLGFDWPEELKKRCGTERAQEIGLGDGEDGEDRTELDDDMFD